MVNWRGFSRFVNKSFYLSTIFNNLTNTDMTRLIWNDPEPIEGNDYTVTKAIMGEEISTIYYNGGLSEAEVYNDELELVHTPQTDKD